MLLMLYSIGSFWVTFQYKTRQLPVTYNKINDFILRYSGVK